MIKSINLMVVMVIKFNEKSKSSIHHRLLKWFFTFSTFYLVRLRLHWSPMTEAEYCPFCSFQEDSNEKSFIGWTRERGSIRRSIVERLAFKWSTMCILNCVKLLATQWQYTGPVQPNTTVWRANKRWVGPKCLEMQMKLNGVSWSSIKTFA